MTQIDTSQEKPPLIIMDSLCSYSRQTSTPSYQKLQSLQGYPVLHAMSCNKEAAKQHDITVQFPVEKRDQKILETLPFSLWSVQQN